ncbi:hypothetical protein B0H63DRAFT_473086 [Podospora didyma]|uniref:Heterokaryon incompatibility domain-containing protein n=1 Tax=Podospora didyma TaxID=330526 RepID=A0AAE0NQA6_9PEZI|nr:hypothetical protein B0H63DRAFT_473086 [Podospora didyma]
MRQIYFLATGVLAWTGDSSDDSHVAISHILEVSTAVGVEEEGLDLFEPTLGRVRFDPTTGLTPQQLLQVGLDVENMNWAAIWSFLNRPYWGRIWVLQELATCGVVRRQLEDRCAVGCGSTWMPKRFVDATVLLTLMIQQSITVWSDFHHIAEPVRTLLSKGLPLAWQMFMALSQLPPPPEIDHDGGQALSWLLRTTKAFRATDPRDKVYALLGLVRKRDQAFIVRPDYSLPKESVFTSLVIAAIKDMLSLEILEGNRKLTNDFGPSWIPELQDGASTGPSLLNSQGDYRASAELEADVSVDEQASLLSVRGFRLGVVRESIGPWIVSGTTQGDLSSGRSAFEARGHDIPMRQLMAFSDKLPENQRETFWRALVVDKDYSGMGNEISPAPVEFERMYRVMFGLDEIPEDFQPDKEEFDRACQFMLPFERNLVQTQMDRCFICTEDGRMGWGPMCARPGDEVVILLGGSFPFVLRLKGQHYELIGDAYVQGVMRGEYVDEVFDELYPGEWFTLC